MNLLKVIDRLRYKLLLIKEVLFNDAVTVKHSMRDKDIDEINSRNSKIRELEAKKEEKMRAEKLSLSECSICKAKSTAVHSCVKCKKIVCEDCATYVPETESGFESGYYCPDCW